MDHGQNPPVAVPSTSRYHEVMSALAAPSLMTEAEYLAMERASSAKHELWNGQVFAMTGGTLAHATLAMNFGAALVHALRDRRCRVLSSDAKVYIPITKGFVYPDVSVVCGPMLTYQDSDDVLLNPSVVIEVLSKSTERIDRVEKFAGYRSIVSLQDYILVNQRSRRLEVYSRQDDASWVLRDYNDKEPVLSLFSIDATIVLDDIYRGVLDAPA